MHPVAAIVLVILTGLAWLGTITTLLVSRANARRRQPPAGAEGTLHGAKGRARDRKESKAPL